MAYFRLWNIIEAILKNGLAVFVYILKVKRVQKHRHEQLTKQNQSKTKQKTEH